MFDLALGFDLKRLIKLVPADNADIADGDNTDLARHKLEQWFQQLVFPAFVHNAKNQYRGTDTSRMTITLPQSNVAAAGDGGNDCIA